MVEITAFRMESKSCNGFFWQIKFPPMRDLGLLTGHVIIKSSNWKPPRFCFEIWKTQKLQKFWDCQNLGVHLHPRDLGVHLHPQDLGVHLHPQNLGVKDPLYPREGTQNPSGSEIAPGRPLFIKTINRWTQTLTQNGSLFKSVKGLEIYGNFLRQNILLTTETSNQFQN